MPGPLRCAAWLDELVPENGTALRTLHDADDDRRRHDEYAVDRFELAGWHLDASPTRTDSGVRSREAGILLQVGDTCLRFCRNGSKRTFFRIERSQSSWGSQQQRFNT